ncbi:uncharacterized protein MONBRDRAFT_9712 [Monosiga brevicollis MX1]|uniref:VWFA domain-containing protein n=1 Tax=Monosiga brevicollis TaxID=81824 RepID=A9V3J5_MONBE|nr:uncharacterized protein MONBRDRAFT_9712 [Monosiga brevicollis MX1]EDQ87824.1 predicted protein [Monosiga brevicollis MX1]|eukprot:XP_001747357.1 hypothetical protein [Monosiga brevicollis MX1]
MRLLTFLALLACATATRHGGMKALKSHLPQRMKNRSILVPWSPPFYVACGDVVVVLDASSSVAWAWWFSAPSPNWSLTCTHMAPQSSTSRTSFAPHTFPPQRPPVRASTSLAPTIIQRHTCSLILFPCAFDSHPIAFATLHTGAALEFTAGIFVDTRADPSKPLNIVLLTDGHTLEEEDVLRAGIDRVQTDNVYVHAIGVGYGLDAAELGLIATSDEYVTQVPAYAELLELSFASELVDSFACASHASSSPAVTTTPAAPTKTRSSQPKPSTTLTTTTATTTTAGSNEGKSCWERAQDVVFVLDGSDHTEASDFASYKKFISHFMTQAGPNTRPALVVAADTAHVEFSFADATPLRQLKTLLSNAGQRFSSNQDLGPALAMAAELLDNLQAGARPWAEKVIVLITPNAHLNPSSAIENIETIRLAADRLVAVGMGGADSAVLRTLAGANDATFALKHTGALLASTEMIVEVALCLDYEIDHQNLICQDGLIHETNVACACADEHCRTCERAGGHEQCRTCMDGRLSLGHACANTCPDTFVDRDGECVSPLTPFSAHIVLALDDSTSVGYAGFQRQVTWASSLAQLLTFDSGVIQMGAFSFDDRVQPISRFTSVEVLVDTLQSAKWTGGASSLAEALSFTGARYFQDLSLPADHRRILVILLDGAADDTVAQVARQATQLRQMGVTIFAIAVQDSNDVQQQEAQLMAAVSSTVEYHLMRVPNMEALMDANLIVEFASRLAGEDGTNPTTRRPPTTTQKLPDPTTLLPSPEPTLLPTPTIATMPRTPERRPVTTTATAKHRPTTRRPESGNGVSVLEQDSGSSSDQNVLATPGAIVGMAVAACVLVAALGMAAYRYQRARQSVDLQLQLEWQDSWTGRTLQLQQQPFESTV